MPLPGAVLRPSPLLLPRDGLLLGALRWLLLPGRLGALCLLLRPLLLRLLGALLLWPLSLRLLGALLLRLLFRSLLRPLLLRLLSRSGLLRPLLLRLLSRSGLLRPLLLRLLFRSGLLRPLLLRLLFRSGLLRPLLLRLLFRSSLLRPLLLRLLSRSGLLRPLLLRLLFRSGLLRPLLLRLPCGLALFFLRVCRFCRPEEHKQGSRTDNSNQLHRNRPPSLSLLGMVVRSMADVFFAILFSCCKYRVFVSARAGPSSGDRARMHRGGDGQAAWVQNLPSGMQIWLRVRANSGTSA
jgi:hypothetical protein